MLSDDQLKTARDILVATGQVFLASLIVPYFTGEYSEVFLWTGVTLTIGSWSTALFVTKKSIYK